jgi:hypothetical protein
MGNARWRVHFPYNRAQFTDWLGICASNCHGLRKAKIRWKTAKGTRSLSARSVKIHPISIAVSGLVARHSVQNPPQRCILNPE